MPPQPSQPARRAAGAAAPAGNTNTAVAIREDQQVATIRNLISSEVFRKQVADALPQHLDADRMTRVFLTAITKTPKLAQCSQASLMSAMMDCSAMGLEPDGYYAHLIPYGQKCTLIVDYKGLVELINRAGVVDFIDAVVVFENDEFTMQRGTDPKIVHIPKVKGPRGEMIGAYVVAHVKGTKIPKFEWMPKEEIDAIRKRSASANSGPWVTDYNEMSKKTVLRRITKTIPKSAQLLEQLEKDLEHDGVEDVRVRAAKPAHVVTDLPQAPEVKAPDLKVVEAPADQPPQAQDQGSGDQAGAGEQGNGEQQLSEAEQAELEAEQAEAHRKAAEKKAAAEAETKRKADEAAAKKAADEAAKKTTAAPKTGAANPPPSLPPSSDSDVPALVEKCKAAGITEQQVCNFAAAKYKSPASSSIKELAEYAPRRVTLMLHQFDALKADIAKA